MDATVLLARAGRKPEQGVAGAAQLAAERA
jgi:hypothetical protein